MNTTAIDLLFLPYDESFLLKKDGFDGICLAGFRNSDYAHTLKTVKNIYPLFGLKLI